jgi:hypothetical protein
MVSTLILGLAAALGAQAAPPAAPQLSYYHACELWLRDPAWGSITVERRVGQDGRVWPYHATWSSPSSAPLDIDVRWTGDAALAAPGDNAYFSLTVRPPGRGARGTVRIVIRRDAYGSPLAMTYAGPYGRAERGAAGASGSWSELGGLGRGVALLYAVVARRNGDEQARLTLDTAWLDGPAAAAAAARPELDAKVADYRNRCERREVPGDDGV